MGKDSIHCAMAMARTDPLSKCWAIKQHVDPVVGVNRNSSAAAFPDSDSRRLPRIPAIWGRRLYLLQELKVLSANCAMSDENKTVAEHAEVSSRKGVELSADQPVLDEETNRKLLRKIDLRLMPVVCLPAR